MDAWVFLGDGVDSDSDGDNTVQVLDGSDTASEDGSESGFAIVRVGRGSAGVVFPVDGVVGDTPALEAPRAAVPQPAAPGFFKVLTYGEAFSAVSSGDGGPGDVIGGVAEHAAMHEEDGSPETTLPHDEALPDLASITNDDGAGSSSEEDEENHVTSDDGEEDDHVDEPNGSASSSRDAPLELAGGEHQDTEVSDAPPSYKHCFDILADSLISDTEHVSSNDSEAHKHIAESVLQATASNAEEAPPEFHGGKYDDIDVSDEEDSKEGYIDILPTPGRGDTIGIGSYDDIDTSDMQENNYDEDDEDDDDSVVDNEEEEEEEMDDEGDEDDNDDDEEEDDDDDEEEEEEEEMNDEGDEDDSDDDEEEEDDGDDDDEEEEEEEMDDEGDEDDSDDDEEEEEDDGDDDEEEEEEMDDEGDEDDNNDEEEDDSDEEEEEEKKYDDEEEEEEYEEECHPESFGCNYCDIDTFNIEESNYNEDTEEHLLKSIGQKYDDIDTSDMDESDNSDSFEANNYEEHEGFVSGDTEESYDEDDDIDSSDVEESEYDEDSDIDSSEAEESDYDDGEDTDNSDTEESSYDEDDDIDTEESTDDEDYGIPNCYSEESGNEVAYDFDAAYGNSAELKATTSGVVGGLPKSVGRNRKYDDIDSSNGEEMEYKNMPSSGAEDSDDDTVCIICPMCGDIHELNASKPSPQFNCGCYDSDPLADARQVEVICKKIRAMRVSYDHGKPEPTASGAATEHVERVGCKYDDIDTDTDTEDGVEVYGHNDAELNAMAGDVEEEAAHVLSAESPAGPARSWAQTTGEAQFTAPAASEVVVREEARWREVELDRALAPLAAEAVEAFQSALQERSSQRGGGSLEVDLAIFFVVYLFVYLMVSYLFL